MARGFLLSIFSALLYSLLPILHQRNAAIPVNLRTLGQYGFALPVFLAFIPRMDWHLAGPDWWGLAHLGVLGTFVAHSLWIRATTVLPTCESGIIYYLYVPIAMLLAWIFLGEPWVTTRVVGAGLIIFASCLGVFSQSRRRS